MKPLNGGESALDLRNSLAQLREEYQACLEKPSSVLSRDSALETASEVLILEGLGRLGRWSEPERSARVEALIARLDHGTGQFVGLSGAPDPVTTVMVLQALDALGAKSSHRLFFGTIPSDVLIHEGWGDPWLAAQSIASNLLALIWAAEHEGRTEARPAVHAILDALDAARDSRTGLYGTSQGASFVDALAAAGLVLPFYDYLARPWTGAAKALDLVLNHWQAGLRFAEAEKQLSIVALAACLSATYEYREADVRRLLSQLAEELHGGRVQGDAEPGAGDRLGSVAASLHRLTCLAVIEQGLFGGTSWHFRRLPFPGTCRPRQLSEQKRARVASWLRPQPETWRSESPPSTPDVSVVVTCYDLGFYLHEALDSALTQESAEIEVVVVDDGSTDELTLLVLKQLQSPRLRILRLENQGLVKARNSGIAVSRGRYVCCLDADDRLRPGYLGKAVGILDGEPNVGVVTGDNWRFDSDDAVVAYRSCGFPELLTRNRLSQSAVFRRGAWERVGGHRGGFSLAGIEDWDFWLRLVEAKYGVHVIPEIVLDYRIRPRSMSSSMLEPENWGRLFKELVHRHEELYLKYFSEVLELKASEVAESWAWLRVVDRGKAWWEAQSAGWQRQSEGGLRLAEERQRWIQELERRMDWLTQQRQGLIEEIERKDRRIDELSTRILELERGETRLGD